MISAEKVQAQKLRGKEIYSRDNSYTADRERERREREAAAKTARQEAAERSRQLSREWAERQKVKRIGTNVTTADAAGADAAGEAGLASDCLTESILA
jgi:hypothetical protein